MILLPVGTDVRLRKTPVGNYILLALNVAIFLYTDVIGDWGGRVLKEFWTLDAQRPLLWQYLTYQFLHGDSLHLAGNMIFLWIFGNAVCDRMGNLPYLLFYLAGGVFAGLTFTLGAEHPIVGASGAIAAVTTAFLALFPRVHVRMILWAFVLLVPFALPSSILIVFKIILWDNILAPSLDRGATSNVAYSAHLGGYAFGFAVAMALLLMRALPRNPFDMAGIWSRWHRRAGIPDIPMGGPIRYARPVEVEELSSRPLEERPLTPAEALRERLIEQVRAREYEAATVSFEQLRRLAPDTVLPHPIQRDLANYLARSERHEAAVAAYEALLQAYPHTPDAGHVHLLTGMLLNRHLQAPERSIRHLTAALERLEGENERGLALQELQDARAKLS
jgi:membrane associated rhomboid family serine protease